MRTILLVEDEKMIRRDFRKMIQRSEVPVGAILECANGREALEILRDHPVDVMVTDIGMPDVDGLELVKRVSRMERRPYIVVVSDYDEFTYAVEMLRNGAKEYLLKPVGADQLIPVLKKLDEELASHEAIAYARRTVSRRRLRMFLAREEIEDLEFIQFVEDNKENFFEGEYRVCVFEKETDIEPQSFLILLDDLEDGRVCILEEEYLLPFLRTEAADACVGISTVRNDMRDLKRAYLEAKKARRAAFCLGRRVYAEELAALSVPQSLIEADTLLLEESSHSKRLHLIGTDRVSDLVDQWGKLFGAAASLHITPAHFEKEILETIGELSSICSGQLPQEDDAVRDSLCHIFWYHNLEAYQEELMNWILELNQRIRSSQEESSGQNRMKQAVEYIEENYQNDLNMAVVSNYISMNYSLFSYEFKRYTGSNFVNYLKDLRLNKAQELLSTTDLRVMEISKAVGYDNVKHFMKTFKTMCGVSPSEYRRMHG